MSYIKYVIIDQTFPVLFASGLPHTNFKCWNVTSAGFIKFYLNDKKEIDLVAHGHSEGLGSQSAPEDSEKIKLILNLNGGEK